MLNPLNTIRISDSLDATSIAIIGMAGRFPGPKDIDEYWRNLRDGIESVIFLTDKQVEALGVDSEFRKTLITLKQRLFWMATIYSMPPFSALVIEKLKSPIHSISGCAWEGIEMASYNTMN
jgi:beta-ketoacyl synthase-like protein